MNGEIAALGKTVGQKSRAQVIADRLTCIRERLEGSIVRASEVALRVAGVDEKTDGTVDGVEAPGGGLLGDIEGLVNDLDIRCNDLDRVVTRLQKI